MMTYNDYPIEECVKTADRLIAKGAKVFQKWTCAHCGARETMNEPNVFFKSGKCEDCGKLTNIEKRGCNYLVIT